MSEETRSSQSDTTSESRVRRQLLKMAAYVPPAMLGVMISANHKVAQAAVVGQTINCGGAGAIVVSANGMACCPCVPTSNQYNLNNCNLNRCQLGNCTACTQVTFTSTRQCNRTVSQGGCTCVCTPIGGGRRRRRPATCV